MKAKGGRRVYGFPIGIIVLDTAFPRIPGDIGNAATFDFPVLYRIVEGAFPHRVVRELGPALLPPFIEAAQRLEREGVGAITTSCGFLALFQRELAAAVRIPIFTSRLLLLLVARMLPAGRQVGILTVEASSLTPQHLAAVGIDEGIPLVIMGLEGEEEFTRVLLGNEEELDVTKATEEHVRVARRLVADHPDVGALVLECTNMPPYAKSIQQAVGLPVFDIVLLTRMVHAALAYGGYPLF